MTDLEKDYPKKIKAEDNDNVEITFNFKYGERTKEFDNLILELTGLVNDRRKENNKKNYSKKMKNKTDRTFLDS